MTSALSWIALTASLSFLVGWVVIGGPSWPEIGGRDIIVRFRAQVLFGTLLLSLPLQVLHLAHLYGEIRQARADVEIWLDTPSRLDRARESGPWHGWQLEVRQERDSVLDFYAEEVSRAGWEMTRPLEWVSPQQTFGRTVPDSSAFIWLERGGEHIQLIIRRHPSRKEHTLLDVRPTNEQGGWLRRERQ